MRLLVLGASGMLGRALVQVLGAAPGLELFAASGRRPVEGLDPRRVRTGLDVLDDRALTELFAWARPEVAINAIGLIKQHEEGKDWAHAEPINRVLPHRLAFRCNDHAARLVHVSTDCVFDGRKGLYRESDLPDAADVYGLTKRLGEVVDHPRAITLRTSIIGREKGSASGLIEWFMNASGPVQGWRRAVFSGLPTVVLAEVIRDHILPRPDLHGLYHLSADPIDKLTLLRETAKVYGLDTAIDPSDRVVIDRSLNSDRFRAATGWRPAPWPDMLAHMRDLQG